MKEKHLTLNDIHIGDYVQEWLAIPGKWGTPMYIDGIFANGDIYLNLDGNEADPFDSTVRDIYDIPIDFGILSHFGFFECDHHVWTMEYEDWHIVVSVYKPYQFFTGNAIVSNSNGTVAMSKENINSIRKLQHWFYEETDKVLKLVFE